MARPPKPIDEEQVRALARKGWSVIGIASFFRVHRDTITDRFSNIIAEARQEGCGEILELLWRRAREGSDKVLIHLADRILGPVAREIKLSKEQAIKVLEDELKREGVQPSDEGEGQAPESTDDTVRC